MPVTESFVQVAPDGAGKLIDNVALTTSQGLVQRQVTVQGDPEDPDARGKVVASRPAADAYGVVTRQPPPGVDTDAITLTDAFTQPVMDTVMVQLLFLSNITGQPVTVSATDGNDVTKINNLLLQPGDVKALDLKGATWTDGVKWKASAAASVVGQIVGD